MIASRCHHPTTAFTSSRPLGLQLCRPLHAPTAAARNSRTVCPVPCQAQVNSDRAASDGDVDQITGLKRPRRPQQRSPQQHDNTSSSDQGPKRSKPAPGSSIHSSKPAAKGQHGTSGSDAAGAGGRTGGKHNSNHRPDESNVWQLCDPQRQDSPQQPKQPQRPGHMGSKAAKPRLQGKGQGSVDPPLLTAWIKAASSPQQLLQLVQQHAADINPIHLSAAYTQAARVCGSSETVAEE